MTLAVKCDTCGRCSTIPADERLPEGWLALVVAVEGLGGPLHGRHACSHECMGFLIDDVSALVAERRTT